MNPLKQEMSSTPQFLALLCIDSQELTEIATSQLTTLGFEVHTVPAFQEAITQLHSHSYQLVMTSEDFAGGDAATNPILAELATIPLDFRRPIFVILVGPTQTSLSEMQAFAFSVDLVIQPGDVSNLKAIVGQGFARCEALYATFNAVAERVRQE